MTKTPEIDTLRKAQTTTATAATAAATVVTIHVAKIDSETDNGWYVYGYRGSSMYPRLYFIPKEA